MTISLSGHVEEVPLDTGNYSTDADAYGRLLQGCFQEDNPEKKGSALHAFKNEFGDFSNQKAISAFLEILSLAEAANINDAESINVRFRIRHRIARTITLLNT
ncbi:hypothetical protein Aduo_001910 [Ancylostoma duodenale]